MNKELQEELTLKYLYGQLSDEEEEQWKVFQEGDSAIEEDLAFFADFVSATELEGEAEIKLNLQNLEANLQKKKTSSSKIDLSPQRILEKINEAIDFTLDELTALFAPIPNYELATLQPNRSAKVKLTAPQNGVNIEGGILTFVFEKPTPEILQLKIENNRQELLLETTIPRGSESFELQLEETTFVAGRFYWKLVGSEGTQIGVFFVRKDLQG